MERRLLCRCTCTFPQRLRCGQVKSEDSPHQRGGDESHGKVLIPVAVWREQQLLRDEDDGAPDEYADMPDINFDYHSDDGNGGGGTIDGDSSDDEDHNGASGRGLDRSAASQEGPFAPPHRPPVTDLGPDGTHPPAGAKLPAYTGIAPGTDTRGMGKGPEEERDDQTPDNLPRAMAKE